MFFGVSMGAQAASIIAQFEVSSAISNNGCSPSTHGLWTNGFNVGGTCGNFFDIDSGTLTEFDDGTAKLWATATNGGGFVADIELELSDFSATPPGPVKQGGFSGSSLTNGEKQDIIDTWRFYEDIQGTITINSVVYQITILGGSPAYQQGDYANDKTPDFGASAWLKASRNGYDYAHWDINLDLTPVPLPAAVWLFGSAIVGLVGIGRRRKLAAAA